MKTNLQGSTHNIPDSIWWLFAFAGLFRCLLTSIAPYSTCSISYLNEYVMMSSITTKQPVRMPLIYSTACTLSSESKQRSQVNGTYCDLWQLLGSMFIFGLSLLSFSFLSSSPSHNSKIQAGPVLVAMVTGRGMCHMTRRESKSRRWPLLPAMSLVYKENPPCEDTMGVLRRWVWRSEVKFDWLDCVRTPYVYKMYQQQAARIQK